MISMKQKERAGRASPLFGFTSSRLVLGVALVAEHALVARELGHRAVVVGRLGFRGEPAPRELRYRRRAVRAGVEAVVHHELAFDVPAEHLRPAGRVRAVAGETGDLVARTRAVQVGV